MVVRQFDHGLQVFLTTTNITQQKHHKITHNVDDLKCQMDMKAQALVDHNQSQLHLQNVQLYRSNHRL